MEEKAKNSIISIIDSVITESHEERMRANAIADGQNGDEQSASASNTPSTMGTDATDIVVRMNCFSFGLLFRLIFAKGKDSTNKNPCFSIL